MSTDLSTALQNLSDVKDDIVDTLAEKGAETSSSGFADFADIIRNLPEPILDITQLTPISSTITTSDMYIANVSNKTIVFGMCNSTATSAQFSIPSTFTPATRNISSSQSKLYAPLNGASNVMTTSGWSIGSNNTFTLRVYNTGTAYWYAVLAY